MRTASTPRVPMMGDILSREGVRAAVKALYEYLKTFTDADDKFKGDVAGELTPLYAEASYSPGILNNGAQTTITITVTGATLGWEVSAAYDKDLQALVMGVPYVSATDTVKIILFNNTGAGVTLTSGKWRVYVKPRLLTP